MDIFEVVRKLIGPVDPVGESHTDEVRYDNLKQLTELTEKFLVVIFEIENQYKNNHQASMKRASVHCAEFLDSNSIQE